MSDSSFRHDFTNNCLRLEVLAKLICEDLQKNLRPDPTQLKDFETFTKIQLEYIEKMKEENNL